MPFTMVSIDIIIMWDWHLVFWSLQNPFTLIHTETPLIVLGVLFLPHFDFK
jgi:hypothetical protein